jgi:hypothetical protein
MKTLFYNPLLLALCAFLTFPLSAQEWNRREQPQNPATIHPQVPVKPYDSALDIVQNAQGPESAPCDNPTPIVCGLSLTNQSNNTGSNQLNYIAYKQGCLASSQNGGWDATEKVYRLAITERTSVHIVLDIKTAGKDLDIFLASSCQPNFACFAFSKENSTREVIDVNLVPNTYFIIVDGFYTSDVATFDLSVNCTCTCVEPAGDLPNGQILTCDNFQDYKTGGLDAQSTRWNKFPDAGFAPEDARVEQSGTNRYGRFQATATNNEPDMVYYLDDKESGRYRISWRMRVETGKRGYFAMLHERNDNPAAPAGTVWAYEVFFRPDRTGEVRFGSLRVTPGAFTFPQGAWFNVMNIVDLNKDSVELWVNNTFIHAWKFSLAYGSGGTQPNLKRMSALNFFAGYQLGNDFSIDDLCVWTTKTPCAGTGNDPICTGSGQRFANEGTARCQLYTGSEFDDCLTVCDYGGTLIYRGDNFQGVLDNSDIAAGFVKNDSCVRIAYGNNFPNPLFADIYVFNKTDNQNFFVSLNNNNNSQVKYFVFSCRSNPNCAVQRQSCLKEVPGVGFTPAPCNNVYYIVVTGPAGATYSLGLFPNGVCGSSFPEIACGQTVSGTTTSINGAFSKSGGGYVNCYAGSRNYAGGERIYRFYVNAQQKTKLTLTPTVLSNRMGMFVYSFICGQQCINFAENGAAGGKVIIEESLPTGVYYVAVDSDAGNPAFQLSLECQTQITTITTYVTEVGDTCRSCTCLARPPLNDPVVINDYCACKGTDRTMPHLVDIKVSNSSLFSSNDQIWFLYNNEANEPSSQLLYQKAWKIPAAGSIEDNANFELGVDKTGDLYKCSYNVNDPFQIYLVQNNLGQEHKQLLEATYAAGTSNPGRFQANTNTKITNLRRIGDIINFTVPPPQSIPPSAGTRNIEVQSNGPWTVQLVPAPGFPNANWLTLSRTSGTGGTLEPIRLTYTANTINQDGTGPESPFPRVALLRFTYTRNQNFRYSVRVEQQGTCIPANVTIDPSPAPYCGGNTVTLTANPGQFNGQSLESLYNYAWSSGQTTSSIDEILSAGTTVTRSVTISNKQRSCPNTAVNTRTITVGQDVNATINAPASVCAGLPAALSVTGGTAYVWSTGSTSATINPIPMIGDNTYAVTVSTTAGCSGVFTRTVNILPLPTPGIAPVASVCAGQTTTLTASGGVSYAWNTNASGSTLPVTPLTLPFTTYTVTATAANGCTATATRSVEVSPTVVPTVSAPTSVCPGSIATLTASGPSGATFAWSTGGVGNVITPTVSAPTSYTVTATLNGCSGTAVASVGIRPAPSVSIAKTDAACGQPTGSALAIGSGGTAPFQYRWADGQTGSSLSGLAAGTYNLTVTDAAGCTASGSVVIGNTNGPTASIAVPPTVCAGRQVNLNAGTSGGALPYTYLWSNGATNATLQITAATAATYTVTVRDANGCTSVAEVPVTVHTPPTPNIVGNSAVCSGQSLSLSGAGGVSYVWSTGATTNTISVAPTAPVSIGLTATDASGCTASVTRSISLHPQPTAVISGTLTICAGETTVLTASGGLAYSWSSGQSNPVAVLTPAATTSYMVTVVNEFGCSATTTRQVTVNPVPPATINGDRVTCAGNTVRLSAGGGSIYNWSTGQNTAAIDVSPTASATYTVTVSNGSCAATAVHNVLVDPRPVVTIGGNTLICSGGSTVLTGFGGNTYIWSTGANSQNITVEPAVPTTYTVTVTNTAGCTATGTATVTLRPATVLALVRRDAACNLPTGSITVSVSGGTAPFNYTWSNGATTTNLSNVAGDTYTVTTTDVHGCTASAVATLGNTAGPTLSVSGGQVICQGTAVQIQATPIGGTQPYTYQWSNGAGTAAQSVSPVLSTTYTAVVRDANGCTASGQAAITVNSLPTPGIVGGSSVCSGGNANLTAIGGQLYEWSNGASGPSISPTLTVGTTFTVTVTSNGGCTATASQSVSVNPLPPVTIIGNTDICPGSATVLTASGALAYKWSTGASNPVIPVAPASVTSYSVTGTDGNGCSAVVNIQINIRPVPTLNLSKTDAACGLPSGTASAQVTGGTGPFIYNWSNGATASALSGLPAGNYGLSILDGNGCTVSGSIAVGNTNGPTLQISEVARICAGQTAALTATVSGGALPYTYLWNTNSTAATLSVSPASNSTYTVTVRDANGCTAAAQQTVSVNPLPTPSIVGNASVCAGQALLLNAVGGTQYRWNTGATTVSIEPVVGATTDFSVTATDANGCAASTSRRIIANPLPVAAIAAPSGVCMGESAVLRGSGGTAYVWSPGATTTEISVSPIASTLYSVTVSSPEGCTASASQTLTVHPVPEIALEVVDEACGQANGGVTATASGGTPAYRYVWSNGATNAQIGGLTPGNYTVSISDQNGCSSVATTRIASTSGPQANISPDDELCAGQRAVLSVFANGGVSPYSYVWSDGSSTATIQVMPATTTLYQVTVRDAANCAVVKTVRVSVNPLPGATISGSTSICAETPLSLLATGNGTYLWSTGATAANIVTSPTVNTSYTVTVTAATGCTATATHTVQLTPLPEVQLQTTRENCGQGNGRIATTALGGSGGPFRYVWNTGATTASIEKLSAGAFTVTVFDRNNCTQTETAQVANLPGPQANAGSDVAVCAGGSVILNAFATGGTPGYVYRWSNGPVSDVQTFAPAASATYTVSVTDAANCVSVDSVRVTVNVLPTATITGASALCSGQSIPLTANGGVSYRWSTGATMANITVDAPGLYVVSVTGANGCLTSVFTQITLYPAVFAQINVASPVRCAGGATGVLSVSPTGGTPPFAVAWSNGAAQPQIGALPAGSYTATVHDQAGCSATATAILTEPSALTLIDTLLKNDTGNSQTGFIEIAAAGGVPPYNYVWSRDNFQVPGNGPRLSGLGAGSYSLRLGDANGCAVNFGPFVITNSVGTETPVWATHLQVFPNPGTGRFLLRLQGSEPLRVTRLSVVDVLGREIYAQDQVWLSELPTVLELEHLAAGAYILKLQADEQTTNKKIWIIK